MRMLTPKLTRNSFLTRNRTGNYTRMMRTIHNRRRNGLNSNNVSMENCVLSDQLYQRISPLTLASSYTINLKYFSLNLFRNHNSRSSLWMSSQFRRFSSKSDHALHLSYELWNHLQGSIDSMKSKPLYPGSFQVMTHFKEPCPLAVHSDLLILAFIQLLERYVFHFDSKYVKWVSHANSLFLRDFGDFGRCNSIV